MQTSSAERNDFEMKDRRLMMDEAKGHAIMGSLLRDGRANPTGIWDWTVQLTCPPANAHVLSYHFPPVHPPTHHGAGTPNFVSILHPLNPSSFSRARLPYRQPSKGPLR
ncbi:hypothetical protein DM02DRAFT_63355 [Periconia macrospinosa]|uniref:Uncharacterized protein n=1 Tax=Periconia macrospinosa TaxID=97972 RepID=A0A2V1DIJ8_9PLEO|nr:hypothetical protein DM02DRAFT_63355 [Periconia macrospinosa]